MGYRKYLALACVVVILAAGAGCGSKDEPAPAPAKPGTPAPAPAPQAPQDKELVVGHHLDPVTLNPVDTTTAGFQSVYAQIVEEMVMFSADGSTIEPGLATEWSWIDDTTLELKLRQGIMFTNGEPFNAESAKFSIDQFAETPRYHFMLPRDVYKETEIVDEYTIRCHLNRPYAGFLGFLGRGGSALPPKYYAEKGLEGFGQAPIGTGPFVLKEWVKDSHIVLERNPDYWNGVHPISKVTYKVIPEETARVAALETGEIDIALMLPISAFDRVDRNPDTVAISAPGVRKFATHLDTKYSPPGAMADPRVRVAYNLAVDKQMICDQIFGGSADPLPGQWMLENEFGNNPNVKMFPYDPDRAKQLLAEAGHPNPELKLTYTVGRYAHDKELGEAVSSYLEQSGVRVQQEAMEYGAYIELWRAHTCGTHQWGLAMTSDPIFNYLNFTKDSIYEYHSLGDEYARLTDEASYLVDRDKLEPMYHRLAQIMHDDPPMIYLVVPRDIYGLTNRVKNFEPRVSQVLWLFNVDVD